MNIVVCKNNMCKYKSAAGFCGAPLTTLNELGQCKVWFQDNGMRRMAPLYLAEPVYEEEQESPHQENRTDVAECELTNEETNYSGMEEKNSESGELN